MEASLTVFYTYGLRGNLALLPRLHTFLRRLRAEHAAGGRVLLLDLGESCSPEVFPCALTGGRSTLIALDGLGYDAANVDGWLTESDRAKLEAANARIALVDAGHTFTHGDFTIGIRVALDATAVDAHLQITIDPDAVTVLKGNRLALTSVAGGEVGMARVEHAGGGWRLLADGVFALPPDSKPDPTIAGMIEFILSEARYVQKRRGDEHV